MNIKKTLVNYVLKPILGMGLLLAPILTPTESSTQDSLYYLINHGPERYQRFKDYQSKNIFEAIRWCVQKSSNGNYLWLKKYYLTGREPPEVMEGFIGTEKGPSHSRPIVYLFDFNLDAQFNNNHGFNEIWCDEIKTTRFNNRLTENADGFNGNEYPCELKVSLNCKSPY